jgi:hypothetical protein
MKPTSSLAAAGDVLTDVVLTKGRKEVTTMKYEKPEIRAEAAAIATVRGGKSSVTASDILNEVTTVHAYEADE